MLVNTKQEDLKRATDAVAEEERALETAKSSVSMGESAVEVLQLVATAVQQQAHQKIAAVVSRCLEAVFEEPYQFQIIFERKRGKTEARLVFIRDGVEIDPTTASGGGVLDIAAFALRLSCLMLTRPKVRRVLIMDEPFRFLSSNYDERVSDLLHGLSKDLDVQFIMVTHKEGLKIGTVIEI